MSAVINRLVVQATYGSLTAWLLTESRPLVIGAHYVIEVRDNGAQLVMAGPYENPEAAELARLCEERATAYANEHCPMERSATRHMVAKQGYRDGWHDNLPLLDDERAVTVNVGLAEIYRDAFQAGREVRGVEAPEQVMS